MPSPTRKRALSRYRAVALAGASLVFGCSSSSPSPARTDAPPTATKDGSSQGSADVVSATVSGTAGSYQLSVSLRSPDTGCDLYANWWEVVRPDGSLVYRRILAHSHVDEQPFTRSGGPIPASADEPLIVRSHLQPGGYGGTELQGSMAGGFEPVAAPAQLPASLETAPPQPDGCAF